MRSSRLLVAVVCLSPLGLNAQVVPLQDFASCAAIDYDRARVECYDQLAGSLGIRASTGSGKWEISVQTDAANDATAVSLVLAADSATTQSDETIALIVRCRNDDTDLYIRWHDYLGNEASVLTRVGNENAVIQKWNLSADHQSSFYPENPIEFIKQLLEADRIVAEISPYRARPITANFDLAGLSNAIAPLRETCNW